MPPFESYFLQFAKKDEPSEPDFVGKDELLEDLDLKSGNAEGSQEGIGG